jgi:hypothetical protein
LATGQLGQLQPFAETFSEALPRAQNTLPLKLELENVGQDGQVHNLEFSSLSGTLEPILFTRKVGLSSFNKHMLQLVGNNKSKTKMSRYLRAKFFSCLPAVPTFFIDPGKMLARYRFFQRKRVSTK